MCARLIFTVFNFRHLRNWQKIFFNSENFPIYGSLTHILLHSSDMLGGCSSLVPRPSVRLPVPYWGSGNGIKCCLWTSVHTHTLLQCKTRSSHTWLALLLYSNQLVYIRQERNWWVGEMITAAAHGRSMMWTPSYSRHYLIAVIPTNRVISWVWLGLQFLRHSRKRCYHYGGLWQIVGRWSASTLTAVHQHHQSVRREGGREVGREGGREVPISLFYYCVEPTTLLKFGWMQLCAVMLNLPSWAQRWRVVSRRGRPTVPGSYARSQ